MWVTGAGCAIAGGGGMCVCVSAWVGVGMLPSMAAILGGVVV